MKTHNMCIIEKQEKYSKIPLLRPSLVLPKSGLISGVVLILNVEHNSR